MPHLPALITSGDVMPGGGDLNGRRWAGHQLLRAWASFANESGLTLATADPQSLLALQPWLKESGFQGQLTILGLVDPQPFRNCGGLFLPDPSIGRWAQWRQSAGAQAFSLIGQIHTISTSTALGFLQELLTEPVQSWDALICTSTAGREVVEGVLNVREQQLIERLGVSRAAVCVPRPQLPVIPLPLPIEAFAEPAPAVEAKSALGLPEGSAVVLWLGRLSLLTKSDLWPTYQMLERVAKRLDRPLVFVECGPDDHSSSVEHLNAHRQLCPSVQFVRLGGAKPVSEDVKHQALAAADVAVSLVDNPQETFGLAVAEAMAAGVPLVVSDWNGYRDLVRNGIDGFRVPTRWASVAEQASVQLGWQQLLGLEPYPKVAGALAQLVQVDTHVAEEACLALLTRPEIRRAMGAAARQRAYETFHPNVVMSQIEALFLDLQNEGKRLCGRTCFSQSPARSGAHVCLLCQHGKTSPMSQEGFEKLPSPYTRSCLQEPVVGSAAGVTARGAPQRVVVGAFAKAPIPCGGEQKPLIRNSLPLVAKTSPFGDHQPLAALAVSSLLCSAVPSHSYLAAE